MREGPATAGPLVSSDRGKLRPKRASAGEESIRTNAARFQGRHSGSARFGQAILRLTQTGGARSCVWLAPPLGRDHRHRPIGFGNRRDSSCNSVTYGPGLPGCGWRDLLGKSAVTNVVVVTPKPGVARAIVAAVPELDSVAVQMNRVLRPSSGSRTTRHPALLGEGAL